jgi:hypothetical protein
MRNKSLENEILHEITLGDLQFEAQRYIGRKLNKTELNKARKYLQISFGEAYGMIFSAVFDILGDK